MTTTQDLEQGPPYFCRQPGCERAQDGSGEPFQTAQGRSSHERQMHPDLVVEEDQTGDDQPSGPASSPDTPSASPAPAPVAPVDLGNLQPYRGVAESIMDCQICHLPIRPGDEYVVGQFRGPTHAEPCSHQAD